MSDSFKVPVPVNEPIKDYAPNSEEKRNLEYLEKMQDETGTKPIWLKNK